MAEGSVGLVWHKSLEQISLDNGRSTLSFVSSPQETDENAVLCLFFLYIHLLSPIIRAKHHTAVCHDCLHGMPRFHITFAKMAIL